MESNQKKTNAKIKWGVIAGGLLLAAAAILVFSRRSEPAERVEDPTLISLEEPVLQKEDFKAIVESNIAVQGTVRECAYFRAEAGNAVCFIVSMTVDVDTVLHGEVDAASIRIVSGSCYTDTDVGDGFPVRHGLLDCEPGVQSVFVISRVPENAAWDIGGKTMSAHKFGDYTYRLRCSLQDGALVSDDLVLKLDEISE